MRIAAIRPGSVAATWLVCGVMIALQLAVFAAGSHQPYDPDDFMRMQQVSDLLAGQSWWDVTQYRMDPPAGTSMHWSRLVDLPLAVLALLFGLFVSPENALFWAGVFTPMLYLCAAVFLLRAIALRLGLSGMQMLVGLGLLVLMPLVPPAFTPLRVDHHVPQAVLALVCALALLHAPSRRASLIGGAAAAAWLNISLEGLPVVALLAALYGLRYVLTRETALGWFLTALAVSAPAISLATRPANEFALWCDILLPAHWASFAAAAGLAVIAARLPAQDRLGGRVLALAPIPLICAPLYLALIGTCPADPFATIDPLLRTWFLSMVGEGLPVWVQPRDMMAMALCLPVLIGAGLLAALRAEPDDAERRMRWYVHAALALGVALYGLWVLREMLVAQLLAVPFVIALLGHAMPRARSIAALLPRVLATVLVLVFVTPTGPSLLGKLTMGEDHPATGSAAAAEAISDAGAPSATCNYADLTRLPTGFVISTYNASPAILSLTPHDVTSGPYHRNAAGLGAVINFFMGDAGAAEQIARSRNADYLAVCLDDETLSVFGEGRPQSMAYRLASGDAPGWLQPVPSFDGSRLRVWAVRPDGTLAPAR